MDMETIAKAERVISAFNGTTLDGREITVAEAWPRRERSRDSGG